MGLFTENSHFLLLKGIRISDRKTRQAIFLPPWKHGLKFTPTTKVQCVREMIFSPFAPHSLLLKAWGILCSFALFTNSFMWNKEWLMSYWDSKNLLSCVQVSLWGGVQSSTSFSQHGLPSFSPWGEVLEISFLPLPFLCLHTDTHLGKLCSRGEDIHSLGWLDSIRGKWVESLILNTDPSPSLYFISTSRRAGILISVWHLYSLGEGFV